MVWILGFKFNLFPASSFISSYPIFLFKFKSFDGPSTAMTGPFIVCCLNFKNQVVYYLKTDLPCWGSHLIMLKSARCLTFFVVHLSKGSRRKKLALARCRRHGTSEARRRGICVFSTMSVVINSTNKIKWLHFPLCVSLRAEIFYLIVFSVDICCEAVSFCHVL